VRCGIQLPFNNIKPPRNATGQNGVWLAASREMLRWSSFCMTLLARSRRLRYSIEKV